MRAQSYLLRATETFLGRQFMNYTWALRRYKSNVNVGMMQSGIETKSWRKRELDCGEGCGQKGFA